MTVDGFGLPTVLRMTSCATCMQSVQPCCGRAPRGARPSAGGTRTVRNSPSIFSQVEVEPIGACMVEHSPNTPHAAAVDQLVWRRV